MKDYHAILQVAENASRSEMQAAYRQLAKKYHPDVNKSADAHEKFCEITEAYEFLMNHWPRQSSAYPDAGTRDQKYATYHHSEEYERFRQEVRERAQQQAKMKYEKFRQQHEAFQTSGIADLGLLLTISIRITGILLFLFLLILPVYVAIVNGWIMMILVFVTWPFAAIIGWYIHDNRKNYLMPGRFYYSPGRIKDLYTQVHPAEQPCYYCPAKPADSIPYKLELLKLKDLKIRTGGFRQHNVNYINQNIIVLIPRSRKAFVLHSVSTLIKLTALLYCLLFLPISSIVWRFIVGIIAGTLVSVLLLAVTRTRSNFSYLLSVGLIFRIILWIFSIVLASEFSLEPFNISTSDSIQFVITSIIIFDSLVMQFLDFVLGKFASRPLFRQFPEVTQKMRSGYRVYNDIPVISVIYPLYKWLFG